MIPKVTAQSADPTRVLIVDYVDDSGTGRSVAGQTGFGGWGLPVYKTNK